MKKLSPFPLSHSVDKCIHHMQKFNNTLLASFPEAEPTPDHLNDVEFLRGNFKCAEYLHCSITTVKRLKRKGIISSFFEANAAWFRISDIIAAKEAHPEAFNFRVYSTAPRKALPKIHTKCHIFSKEVMFICFSFLGVKYRISAAPDAINDQPAIYRACVETLRLFNKLKPFVFIPEEI